MDKCPKCGSVLNNDERASGKCFSCGESFVSTLSKETRPTVSNENMVGGILKAIGILILIFGTIGSIYFATRGYGFEFGSFILPEIGTIVSGMMILGFSEIIQLLQDIKNKLK